MARTQAVGVSVAPGDSVLVLCPVLAAAESEACAELSTVTDPARTSVLSVALTRSVRDRVHRWERHADGVPGETVVSVEPAFQPGEPAGAFATESPSAATDVTVETVDDAEDLTTLGVRITDYLDRWAGSDRQPVVCFHSVTPLLQYVTADRAYEFLDEVTTRCAQADAVAHAHMDPLAHDEETVTTVTALFDSVVEPETGD